MASMLVRRDNEGFTLLELMIVTAVIATVMGLSMVMLKQAGDDARMNILMSHYESRLQTTLDDIVMHAIETSAGRTSLYAYDENGQRNTVLVFATARNMADDYVYVGPTGIPNPKPVWQALAVYALSNHSIYRYMDFTVRTYAVTPYVQAMDATTITVNDGVNTVIFNRNGTRRNANQRVWKLLDNARRLFAFMPAVDDPVGLPIERPQRPPEIDSVLPIPPLYDVIQPPMHMLIEAEIPIEHRQGETLVISLDTGVLARNQN